jgi:hypothetical protein
VIHIPSFLAYEIERGAHGQPEIKGYTREYMEASSPRRQQIVERLEEQGRRGAGAAQIAAHRTKPSLKRPKTTANRPSNCLLLVAALKRGRSRPQSPGKSPRFRGP